MIDCGLGNLSGGCMPWEFFGCDVKASDGGYECVFRCCFPDAESVRLAGDYDGWRLTLEMIKISDGGVWECVLRTDASPSGMRYKYYVETANGARFVADPFAKAFENGGGLASEIPSDEPFLWEDGLWQKRRLVHNGELISGPVNIYELYLPAWKSGISYRTAADELSVYLRQLGCTHVALCDTAPQGAFAPDPRLGLPNDFRYLVNKLHLAGIGVIIDLPHSELKTESALFFTEQYRVDGILIGSDDTDVCDAVKARFPFATVIYESDDHNLPCLPFGEKRGDGNIGRILTYPDSVLTLSHGKECLKGRSFLDMCGGDYDMKFAEMRLLRACQMTLPGKKLTSMGTEFGPFRLWTHSAGLEWFMTDFERHRQLLLYTAELGQLYLSLPALWELDDTECGLEWIYREADDPDVVAFRRFDASAGEVTVVLNFAPDSREGFTLKGLKHTSYEEILSSDAARFGGADRINSGILDAASDESGMNWLKITLAGTSAVILKPHIPM